MVVTMSLIRFKLYFQGDSGGPLQIQTNIHDDKWQLAGIVSQGYGCGLKNFPGLYVPIRNKAYLQWIKDVAFQCLSFKVQLVNLL